MAMNERHLAIGSSAAESSKRISMKKDIENFDFHGMLGA